MAAWEDSSSSIGTTMPGSTTTSVTNRTGRELEVVEGIGAHLSRVERYRLNPRPDPPVPLFVQGEQRGRDGRAPVPAAASSRGPGGPRRTRAAPRPGRS